MSDRPLTNEEIWGTPDVCELKGVPCDFWRQGGCSRASGECVFDGPDGRGMSNDFINDAPPEFCLEQNSKSGGVCAPKGLER